jgi:hypothetical protein
MPVAGTLEEAADDGDRDERGKEDPEGDQIEEPVMEVLVVAQEVPNEDEVVAQNVHQEHQETQESNEWHGNAP